MSLRLLTAGVLTSVQDTGRRGHAAIGVSRAGAMDPLALRLANRLVGNPEHAAALEITLRGPHLRFERDVLIALCGAPIEAQASGVAIPAWRPIALRSGSELKLGRVWPGARAYLAIGGGIACPPVLGSRSSDLNAELGGGVLHAGDALPIGDEADRLPAARRAVLIGRWLARVPHGVAVANWSIDPRLGFDPQPRRPLRVIVGRHFGALRTESQRDLFATEFRIGADSNRVGLRLQGSPLRLAAPCELVSAGVVPGTIQLPPSGAPIILMAEAPTCGGYPCIAHVIEVDRPCLAQRPAGAPLRFTPVSLAEAQTRYLARERVIAALGHRIAERLHA